jgi:hypothetical protein
MNSRNRLASLLVTVSAVHGVQENVFVAIFKIKKTP